MLLVENTVCLQELGALEQRCGGVWHVPLAESVSEEWGATIWLPEERLLHGLSNSPEIISCPSWTDCFSQPPW